MIKYVSLHWKQLLLSTVRDSLSWLLMLITGIGALIAFLPDETAERRRAFVNTGWTQVWPLIVVILIILAVALLRNWPTTKAVYVDKKTDLKVIIECCDLLRQEGLKVIHTVDTFDMELNTIISPRSLHGAFLKQCQEQGVDIDALIDQATERVKPVRTNKSLPGRKEQYSLGTICPIEIKGEPYCCVAFTRLQPNGTIEISKDEYIKCLTRMWRGLADPRVRHEVVNVAVMGNRFVDLPAEFSTEQKIDLMIQTFFASAREKACCHTLRICVHPNNVTDIDFEQYPVIIEHLAKRPVI